MDGVINLNRKLTVTQSYFSILALKVKWRKVQGNAARQLLSHGGKTTYIHADTLEKKSPARTDNINDTLISSVSYPPMHKGKKEKSKTSRLPVYTKTVFERSGNFIPNTQKVSRDQKFRWDGQRHEITKPHSWQTLRLQKHWNVPIDRKDLGVNSHWFSIGSLRSSLRYNQREYLW